MSLLWTEISKLRCTPWLVDCRETRSCKPHSEFKKDDNVVSLEYDKDIPDSMGNALIGKFSPYKFTFSFYMIWFTYLFLLHTENLLNSKASQEPKEKLIPPDTYIILCLSDKRFYLKGIVSHPRSPHVLSSRNRPSDDDVHKLKRKQLYAKWLGKDTGKLRYIVS